jgi:hypothetical protein
MIMSGRGSLGRQALLAAKGMLTLFIEATTELIFYAYTQGVFFYVLCNHSTAMREIYDFSTHAVGLSYLGLAVGSILGTLLFDNTHLLKGFMALCHKLAMRLPRSPLFFLWSWKPKTHIKLVLLVQSPLLLIGIPWYGWTLRNSLHWMIPIIGTGFIGAGATSASIRILRYTTTYFDSKISQLAFGGFQILGGVLAALIPLLERRIQQSIGYGFTSVIFTILALVVWFMLCLTYRDREAYPTKHARTFPHDGYDGYNDSYRLWTEDDYEMQSGQRAYPEIPSERDRVSDDYGYRGWGNTSDALGRGDTSTRRL